MGRKQDYAMHFVFITLFGFAVLMWPQLAATANEPKTIDDFPCSKVATFSSDTTKLTRQQLFYAAHAYDSGDCGKEDDARAFPYYMESANRGDGFAMIRLGYFYLNGTGVERNTEKARYWFRSYALAHPYENVSEWTGMVDTFFYGEPLPDLFLAEMKRAAQDYTGEADLLMRNYHDLSSGNGVKADPSRARTWLLQAVELNDPRAHYEYAELQRSRGNLSGYVVHIRIAAEFNSSKAQAEIGKLHLTGNGVSHWPYKALVWFLCAKAGGQDVDALIAKAEAQLDALNIKLAQEEATKFIEKNTR